MWITGLPGSGKTTLAGLLEEKLLERGLNAERIDEGDVRAQYLPGLGPSREEQKGLVEFLGHVCALLARNGVIAIGAAVSPSEEVRNGLRAEAGSFVEVYARCPPEVCRQRDTEGFYAGARSGDIRDPEGILATYEEPTNPEVLLDAVRESAEACCGKVIRTLELLGYIPEAQDREYSEQDEAKITKRLKDLGYI